MNKHTLKINSYNTLGISYISIQACQGDVQGIPVQLQFTDENGLELYFPTERYVFGILDLSEGYVSPRIIKSRYCIPVETVCSYMRCKRDRQRIFNEIDIHLMKTFGNLSGLTGIVFYLKSIGFEVEIETK